MRTPDSARVNPPGLLGVLISDSDSDQSATTKMTSSTSVIKFAEQQREYHSD